MSLEFSLASGEYNRIGNSPGCEIHLPMVGLSAEECRVFLDESGSLWLTRSSGAFPEALFPPTFFQAGRYRFLIRDRDDPAAGIHRQNGGKSGRRTPSGGLPKIAVLAAVGGVLTIAGAAVWFVRRPEVPMPGSVASLPIPASAGGELKALAHPPPSLELPDAQAAPANPAVSPAAANEAAPVPKVMDLEQLAARVGPCVYLIQVIDKRGDVIGIGTGFCVSADGLVATNYHVVEKGVRFSLLTNEGAKFEDARVVIPNPQADLALLKVDAVNLPFLSLGSADHVAVGKRVAVYGNPRGLAGILSEGIISAPARDLRASFSQQVLPNHGILLQTTAPISPGSSGSPLFDADGDVLGVMTLTGPQNSQNLNFAVPVESLQPMVRSAISGNRFIATTDSEGRSAVNRSTDDDSNPFRGSSDPCTADPEFQEMLRQMRAGNWSTAAGMGGPLTKKYPSSPSVCFVRGQCAAALSRFDQAKSFYLRSIQLGPETSVGWYCLGLCVAHQKRYGDARIALERSVKLNPSYTQAWDELVLVYIMLRDWSEAEHAFGMLARLAPEAAKDRARLILNARFPSAGLNRQAANILAPAGDATNSGLPKYYVRSLADGDSLTLREKPDSSSTKIGSVPGGAEVMAIGKVQMNGSTGWLPIAYGPARGWVAARFLKAPE